MEKTSNSSAYSSLNIWISRGKLGGWGSAYFFTIYISPSLL